MRLGARMGLAVGLSDTAAVRSAVHGARRLRLPARGREGHRVDGAQSGPRRVPLRSATQDTGYRPRTSFVHFWLVKVKAALSWAKVVP